MDDIGQTVAHLSRHLITALSSTLKLESTVCSDSCMDTGIVGGFHNPAIFLQSLFHKARISDVNQSRQSIFLAKIRSPIDGFNSSRRERMTVKSRRVVDIEEGERISYLGQDPVSKSHDDTSEETSPQDWSAVNRRTSVEVHEDSEKSETKVAVSREELGRATWTFLHTLAAQFPERPTKQQERDAKDLMAILSRIYPCKECADHFKDVLRAHPVDSKSGDALAQWMCRVHNVVNRSLGKLQFPCNRVEMRWGALDCDEGACDLHGRFYK